MLLRGSLTSTKWIEAMIIADGAKIVKDGSAKKPTDQFNFAPSTYVRIYKYNSGVFGGTGYVKFYFDGRPNGVSEISADDGELAKVPEGIG